MANRIKRFTVQQWEKQRSQTTSIKLCAGKDILKVTDTMVDVLKKSGVRDAAEGVNVGRDFYEALDERVKDLIDVAVSRAEGNGRRTVKARDV